jgi:hypothetical protein
MTTRTDIHRPVEMDPSDYEYLYAFDNKAPGHLVGVDMSWWHSITNFDPAMQERGTSQCHHCGARIRYVALMRHVPTGYAIAIGETCLDNRFELATKAEFDRLRKAAALDRAKMRIKTAAAEFLTEQNDTIAKAMDRETDLAEAFGLSAYGLRTVDDIRAKLWKYGNLSGAQLALVERLIAEVPVRAAQAAERAAEVQVAAPTGRVTFSGVIVKQEGRDTEWGYVVKLTVKVTTPDGIYLVWVTKPSKVTCEKGDTITMTATLTRGNTEHFAFGKRPSAASVVKADAPSALD